MGNEHFENLILIALPGSGKSEIRKCLEKQDSAFRKQEFHIAELKEIDDYQMVAGWIKHDNAAQRTGLQRVFTEKPTKDEGDFIDSKQWDILDNYLNNEYEALLRRTPNIHDTSTVIFECARGGPANATFPISHGYQRTLENLTPEILKKSAILYIKVPCAEVIKKNDARFREEDPFGELTHRVPTNVMRDSYGCDDIEWLIQQSDRKGFVKTQQNIYVPIGVFDNTNDLTSVMLQEKTLKPHDFETKKYALSRALLEILKPLYTRYKEEIGKRTVQN